MTWRPWRSDPVKVTAWFFFKDISEISPIDFGVIECVLAKKSLSSDQTTSNCKKLKKLKKQTTHSLTHTLSKQRIQSSLALHVIPIVPRPSVQNHDHVTLELLLHAKDVNQKDVRVLNVDILFPHLATTLLQQIPFLFGRKIQGNQHFETFRSLNSLVLWGKNTVETCQNHCNLPH